MTYNTEFLTNLKKSNERLLDDSIEGLSRIADDISSLAAKFVEEIESAYKINPSNTIRSIRQTNLQTLNVLAQTRPKFDAKLVEFNKNFHSVRSHDPSNYSPVSRPRVEINATGRKSKILSDFKLSLSKNSNSFFKSCANFEVATGANPNTWKILGIPALDLIIVYVELWKHAHFGPIGTLVHLLHEKHKAKELADRPLQPTFSLIAEMDTLIEAMTVVAISLRQLPDSFAFGSPVEISYESAKETFDNEVVSLNIQR